VLNSLIGQMLNEKYKIEKQLGQGGMGAVYLGQHIKMGKPVAIKILLSDMVKESGSFERFKREAEATARIKHPNIVSINDFGQTEDGLAFMVMEYVQGYSLRSLLEREIKLTPKHVVKVICQICAAISAAHSAGIIHRDLKPDNIMIEVVDGFEIAKVLDFGIAKLKDSQQQLTAVGGVVGTVTYMSPEQCSSANVDARSDIYSIGIILYQLLSGQLPFQSTNRLAVMVQQMAKVPKPLGELCPELPVELVEVVMQALEKDPNLRQQSATQLSEQLKKAINSVNIMNSIYGSGSNLTKPLNQDDNNVSILVQDGLLEGVLLENKYRLIRQLGQGGMGAVYLGQHIEIGKLVAIKTLLSDMVKELQSFERFKREAEVTAQIKHPNIVAVDDFGQTEDGLIFMVMEYVQGYSLRNLLERVKQLSPKRVITIGRQICAAISAAHSAGIIHRDLKPDNIMIEIIDGFEIVRVLDFGIAKLKSNQHQQLTVAGGILGTATYMSPEQCGADEVDARSDIYSVGIILYQLLSGQLPFQSNDKRVIMLQQMVELPKPLEKICPELPEELVKVVMQALEKDPDLRQQTANELSEQLKAVLSSVASYKDKIINDNLGQADSKRAPTSQKLAISKRFTLKRSLGSGAFGTVYEAYDNDHNTTVALKMLRQADAEQLYQFKREFRALTDIIHPNLVTLYELMSDGEQWFFTMQLVQGVDFLKWVRANSSNLDIERLRTAFKQLVEGIYALHKAGKLHRDIKPSNVLVTLEGCVVILDFGLVMESSIQESLDQIAGTPAYMSPEQATGLAVSEASDWYSAGVMLYEALTGKLPITGNTAIELLVNKQKYDAPAPSTNVTGIPEDLDLLCQDLLKRDLIARPSGADILKRLSKDSNSISLTAPLSFPLPPFIGRESQLTDLHNTYKDVKLGKAGMAFVKGYSGMGKSALVRHFLDEILETEPDIVVLMGRCYEQETVPYKALDSVIDSLTRYLKSLPNLQVKEILPLNVLALARLFPVLKQVESVALANRSVLDIPDPQELRQKAFAAFRELLTNLANKKQLIIFIDDYQWSDFDSTSLLSELIRPPDVPTILLICSYRAEEAENNVILKELNSFQNYAGAKITIANILVKELSEDEAKAVISSLLGESSTGLEVVKRIIKESSGSPFFLYELAQYYQTQLSSLVNLPDNNNLVSIEEVLKSRIAQLSDKACALLEIVAIAGQPLERNLAKMAAKLNADEQVLATLRAGRFLRVLKYSEKEELDTYHDRIRETAITMLPVDIISNHHTKLGTVLESSPNSDPERLLYHFKEAGDKKKATKYALMAASSADQALAFDRASQHYKAAIEMNASNQEDLPQIYTKLAQAQANAGRGAESARSYLVAAKLASSKDSLELQRCAAEQLLMSGHIDEGVVILRKLVDVVGISWPETSMRALAPLLANRLQIWLRGTNFHEHKESELSNEVLFRIDVCRSVAMGLAQVDPLRGSYFNTKHLMLALKAGETNRIVKALMLEVGFTSVLKQARKYTKSLLEKEKEILQRLNHPYILGLVKLSEGYLAFQQGYWKLAQLSLEEAEKTFRENCTGVTWELDTTKYYALLSLQLMGNYREAYDRLPSFLTGAKERSDLYVWILLRTRCLSIQYLVEDEPEKAIDEVNQALEQWSQGGFHVQHYKGAIVKVMIYLYKDYGKGSIAYEFINKQWAAFKSAFLLVVQVIRIEAHQLRANSALAAAAVDNANAKTLLIAAERDANKIDQENLPYATAVALMIRAGIAAAKRKVPEAIKLLISAENAFNIADMSLQAAISRRRRGELIGKDEGRKLIESADTWMANQQIQNPERMTAIFAPGNWS